MKAKDLIESFKKKEYGWEEETKTYRHSDSMKYGDWDCKKEGDIVLFAADCGGYDCTDALRVEFKYGGIELIWEDREYDEDVDLVKQTIHRVKLVELK